MAPNGSIYRCQFCSKAFNSQRALSHHISASKSCYKEWRKALVREEQPSPKRLRRDSPRMSKEPDILEEAVDEFIPPSPCRQATVEDADDDEEEYTFQETKNSRYVEAFPEEAGQGLRQSKTQFENWLAEQLHEGKNPWEPFASREEWALSQWLIKNIGQKATDDYLKLQMVCELNMSIYNKKHSSGLIRLIAKKSYRSTILIHF